uniref:Uncharacterized protein n=1 Tax=Palpitomonas bilix TaxID=652834 RepID=A0A7S3GIU9_9EUKA
MGEKKKSAAFASNLKSPVDVSRSMGGIESQAKTEGDGGSTHHRSNSVPDISAIADFFPSSNGHHHHPKKFQVAPDGAAAKYEASEKDTSQNDGKQPQGGELMKRVSPLDVDTAPQRAADEKGKKESFGLAAYKYLIPLLLWAVVQLFFTVFFVSYLLIVEPSLPRITEASERVTTASELLALAGAYAEAGPDVIPNSDFGVLFMYGEPRSNESITVHEHSACMVDHEESAAASVTELEGLLNVQIGLKDQHESICVHMEDGEVYSLNFSDPFVNGAYITSLQLELETEIDRLSTLMQDLKSGGDTGITAAQSPSQSALLFGGGECLLYDQQKCPQPGDDFYASVHQGLSGLVDEYINLFHYIARSLPPNSRENQERVFNAAMYYFDHVYDGLTRSMELIVEEIKQAQTSMLEIQISALAISLLGLIVSQIFIVLPFIRGVSEEADRSVMMLSALPTKVHIDHILKAATS